MIFKKEIFHFLLQKSTRFRVKRSQSMLIDQHGLLIQPHFPGFLRDMLKDTLAQLACHRFSRQTRPFTLQFDAKYFINHFSFLVRQMRRRITKSHNSCARIRAFQFSDAMLFIGLQSTALKPEEIAQLRHPLLAGVVLFSRNYAHSEQLLSLCQAIRQYSSNLLICVDHEGGRVQRFREGFTLLPKAGAFGRVYDENPLLAVGLAVSAGVIMGHELRKHGVDFSLAPVLDLQDDCSTVIGQRAFHREPSVVIALANALRQGLRSQGMPAVGKHYPGHGRVIGDSHHMLPCDSRSFAERIADRAPFFASIADGIEGIMVAHIMLPEDTLPAGFSSSCLQGLRDVGFQGAILSDDLDMQGALHVAADPVERVRMALDAGADAAMICNHFEDMTAVLSGNIRPDSRRIAHLARLRIRAPQADATARYHAALAHLAAHHSLLY